MVWISGLLKRRLMTRIAGIGSAHVSGRVTGVAGSHEMRAG